MTAAAEAPDTLSEPQRPVPRGWTIRFGLLWFGFWMANLAPIQLVLPNQFDALDHAHKVRDFGLVSGLTGIAAVLTLPLFGALCDRTRSRFGRRRVWMAGGTAVFVVGLLLTGMQQTWWAVGLAWLVRDPRDQHGDGRPHCGHRRRGPRRAARRDLGGDLRAAGGRHPGRCRGAHGAEQQRRLGLPVPGRRPGGVRDAVHQGVPRRRDNR